MNAIEVIAIEGIPLVKPGDDVAALVCRAAGEQKTPLRDGDILVITHKIVSKAEDRIVKLSDVHPSPFAKTIAERSRKSSGMIELILQEAQSIVRMRRGSLVTRTRQGWICANSGIDVSNVSGGDSVVLLPDNPDRSARGIRRRIKEITGRDIAVIISDTTGRPLRNGVIDVAIGVAGIDPIHDLRREKDLFDYTLMVKQVAIVDELSSAAELVIGQAREGVPAAIIRGFKYIRNDRARSRRLLRPPHREMFL